MPGASNIRVEVVFATPDKQFLQVCSIPCKSSVSDAIESSQVQQQFPQHDFKTYAVGIWGRVVAPADIVQEGDRIEIYRPLSIDPRDARRQQAADGGFMGKSRPGADQD